MELLVQSRLGYVRKAFSSVKLLSISGASARALELPVPDYTAYCTSSCPAKQKFKATIEGAQHRLHVIHISATSSDVLSADRYRYGLKITIPQFKPQSLRHLMREAWCNANVQMVFSEVKLL